jgi:hypothetical protein
MRKLEKYTVKIDLLKRALFSILGFSLI